MTVGGGDLSPAEEEGGHSPAPLKSPLRAGGGLATPGVLPCDCRLGSRILWGPSWAAREQARPKGRMPPEMLRAPG